MGGDGGAGGGLGEGGGPGGGAGDEGAGSHAHVGEGADAGAPNSRRPASHWQTRLALQSLSTVQELSFRRSAPFPRRFARYMSFWRSARPGSLCLLVIDGSCWPSSSTCSALAACASNTISVLVLTCDSLATAGEVVADPAEDSLGRRMCSVISLPELIVTSHPMMKIEKSAICL